MKFGIFDHLDDSGVPLTQQYDERLELVEAYDRLGFYAYHLAEHHSTPLGHAPSPSVFLAAISQRTHSLRFGPLVYLLPFYHPLRLLEEICMLDHLSHGRFEFGIGRGISPVEARFYGLEPPKLQKMYEECLAIIQLGMTNKELTFDGEYFQIRKVPLTLRPLQQPHPQMWYGVESPDSAEWAAIKGLNIVTLALGNKARAVTDRYKASQVDSKSGLMGVSRHVVVADTDAEALKIARRAYPRWQQNFSYLPRIFSPGLPPSPVAARYPVTFDELQASGNGIAGSPATVRDYVAKQQAECGINYFVSWISFGDMTVAEAKKSSRLFSENVAPHFAQPPEPALVKDIV